MKNSTPLLLLSGLILFSCQPGKKEVRRENVAFETITDSIYSILPGTLIKTGDYLVWQDPFGQGDFLHAIDLAQHVEVGTAGRKGQGPGEFGTPSLCPSSVKNCVFVFDLNTSHQALFSLDSIKENRNPYRKYPAKSHRMVTRIIQTGEESFITLRPDKAKRFAMASGIKEIEFGDPFIGRKIDNAYDVYQGHIGYNEQNRKFVYASSILPYIEIYDTGGGAPALVYAGEIPGGSYHLEGTTLKPDRRRRGAGDLALLKDYIVTLQRDYATDDTDESTVGRDFGKVSRTVFLYDYKGNLRRIADVGIPIFRIAGDASANTLYAVGINPEFAIVKCEL